LMTYLFSGDSGDKLGKTDSSGVGEQKSGRKINRGMERLHFLGKSWTSQENWTPYLQV